MNNGLAKMYPVNWTPVFLGSPPLFGQDFSGEAPSGGQYAGKFCGKMYLVCNTAERIRYSWQPRRPYYRRR